MRYVLFVLLCVSALRADNVFLKNGYVYRNVESNNLGNSYLIKFNNDIKKLKASEILGIVILPIDSTESAIFETMTRGEFSKYNVGRSQERVEAPQDQMEFNRGYVIHSYENAPIAIVSILAGVGAYLSFSKASDYSDAIDIANAVKGYYRIDTSELEGKKTTYTILGVAASVVGVVTLVYAMTPVTIRMSGNRISMVYTF